MLVVRLRILPVIGFLMLLSTGCGKNTGPELVPVAGTIRLDGQPLSGVVVGYFPVKEGTSAMATTDVAGNYTLQFTATKNGVIPGTYQVRILSPTDDDGRPIGPNVPRQYGDNSSLTVVVERTASRFDFDLSSR